MTPPKKSSQNKLIDYRVYRYDHHAWTPDDPPDTIVLLGGGGSGEFNAETLPGFAFVKIWHIFSFARTSYTTSESVRDSKSEIFVEKKLSILRGEAPHFC